MLYMFNKLCAICLKLSVFCRRCRMKLPLKCRPLAFCSSDLVRFAFFSLAMARSKASAALDALAFDFEAELAEGDQARKRAKLNPCDGGDVKVEFLGVRMPATPPDGKRGKPPPLKPSSKPCSAPRPSTAPPPLRRSPTPLGAERLTAGAASRAAKAESMEQPEPDSPVNPWLPVPGSPVSSADDREKEAPKTDRHPWAVRPTSAKRSTNLSRQELSHLRSEQVEAVLLGKSWEDRGPIGTDTPCWRGQPWRNGLMGGKKGWRKRGGKNLAKWKELASEGRLLPVAGPRGAVIVGKGEAREAIKALRGNAGKGEASSCGSGSASGAGGK